jgi:protein-disulfide isomerase
MGVMNKTKWIIFVVVVAALFGGVIWLSKSNEKPFEGDASKAISQGEIKDHIFGNPEQKVVLIEYGDFQCPGCGAMYQPIKELTEKYKSKLTFIFRNMPLTNIHPNALAAATAAEAAGLQGKYYEMHSKLYENQSAWSSVSLDQRTTVFEGYASQIGLDLNKFKQDISSEAIIKKINLDRSTGTKTFGVDSTPTFVLNGTVIKGQDATNAQTIAQKVEDALKAAFGQDALQPAK